MSCAAGLLVLGCADNQSVDDPHAPLVPASEDTDPGDDRTPGDDDDPDPEPLNEDSDLFAALADVVEDELVDTGVPGAAVAIVIDGDVVFAEGFGVRSPGGIQPVDANTTFAIGSLSKSMTAASLLAIARDRGPSNLQAPLVEALPQLGFPPEETLPLITLETTLTHTSALPDAFPGVVPAAACGDEASGLVLTEVIPDKVDEGYDQWTRPGHAYRHSNVGYALAGLAGEAWTGSYYPDYLRQRLTEPLGMTRTFARSAEVVEAQNHAQGQTMRSDPEGPVVPATFDAAWARPAEGIWSSARDVATFMQFMIDGDPQVLADEDREAMQTPAAATGRCYWNTDYGFGLALAPRFWGWESPEDGMVFETPTVSHEGDLPGFRSFMLWLPEQRSGYVILHNADHAWMLNTEAFISEHILPLPLPVTAPDLRGDPHEWARWDGTFRDPIRFGRLEVEVNSHSVSFDFPDLRDTVVLGTYPACGNSFHVSTSAGSLFLTLAEDPDGQADLIVVEGQPHFERLP